jgi:hypothetical protein
MAGTTWPALVAGRKAKASEVELKFDWIEGSIAPMLGGSMTDGVYDLGTSTAQWNYVYAKSGFILSGVDVRLYAFLLGG